MTKIIKRLIIITFAFICIGAITVTLLFRYINTDNFKATISHTFSKTLGRTVTIKDPIRWSFFPWFGVDVRNITIANPKGSPHPNFATIKRLTLNARLLPLIHGKLAVSNIMIDGGSIHLLRDKEGKNNWSDLIRSYQRGITSDHTPSSKKEFSINISGLHLRNATFSYRDELHNESAVISNLHFNAEHIDFDRPFPVNAQFYFANSRSDLKADVKLASKVLVKDDFNDYQLEQLSLSGFFTHEKTQRKLTLVFNSDVHYQKPAQKLSLDKFGATLGQLSLEGNLTVEQLMAHQPKFSGSIKSRPFNLKQWLENFELGKLTTQSPKALQKVDFASQFKYAGEKLSLSNMTITLDNSHVKAKASVSPNSVNFSSHIDQVNILDYLFQLDPVKKAKSAATTKKSSSAPKLHVNGTIHVDKLSSGSLKIANAKLQLLLKNGVLQLKNLTGKAYGGSLHANAKVNLNKTPQPITIRFSTKKTHLSQLLTGLTGSSKISGSMNLTANVHTAGNTLDALLANLGGRAHAGIYGGTLNFNINPYLNAANLLFSKSRTSHDQVPSTIRFSSINASASLNRGRLSNRDLRVKGNVVTAKGRGTVNLPKRSLSYRLYAHIIQPKDSGVAHLQSLLGGSIPLVISGKLTKPNIDIAKDEILKAILRDQQKKLLKPLQKNIEKHLKPFEEIQSIFQ